MKTGRDVVLKLCKTIKTHDIEFLQQCIDNEIDIKSNHLARLSGCPMNFGLDDYRGLCEDEAVHGYEAQEFQCYNCWKQALEKEIK